MKAPALLKVVAKLDHRTAVLGACHAARSVLPLADGDPQLVDAVHHAEAWVDARASVRSCETAGARAHAAALVLFASGGRAAANAAHAAGYAASAVRTRDDAARAADVAATAVGNRAGAGWRRASTAHSVALGREIGALRVPWITRPEATEVTRTVRAVQVAWDWVATAFPEPTLDVNGLIAAFHRSRRLDLDWADPVQRAIAEHIDDGAVDEVAALLRG